MEEPQRGDTHILLELDNLTKTISEPNFDEKAVISTESVASFTSDTEYIDGLTCSVVGSDGYVLLTSKHVKDLTDNTTFAQLFLTLRSSLNKSKSYLFMHPSVIGTPDEFETECKLEEDDFVLGAQRRLHLTAVRYILKARGDNVEDSTSMDLPEAQELRVDSELQLEVMGMLFSGIDTNAVEETEHAMERTLKVVSEDEFSSPLLSEDEEGDVPPVMIAQSKSQFEFLTNQLRAKFSQLMKYWASINFMVWTGFCATAMLQRTEMIGYVLIVWVCAVMGQFGIYYHGKAVISPYSRQVSCFLLFYLIVEAGDLALRMYFQMSLNKASLKAPDLNEAFIIFHMISLFTVSFMFYGEVFELEPVFSVWNFTFQWFNIGLTYTIPCLAIFFEEDLVDMFVRVMMYISILGQTYVWILPLVAFHLAETRSRICWHIVITNSLFDIPLIIACLIALAKQQLHTSIGMLFTLKVIVFIRQISYNVVYTHILDAFTTPRGVGAFFRNETSTQI